MTIHQLASLLIRIAGLVLLLRSIEMIAWVVAAGTVNQAFDSNQWLFLTFNTMWLTAAVCFIFFPSRVAFNLVPRGTTDATSVERDDIPNDALTRLILVAAGLYFLVDGIKDLAGLATNWLIYLAQGTGAGLSPTSFWTGNFVAQLVTGSVSVAAGLWLLLRPSGIAALIHRLRRTAPDT